MPLLPCRSRRPMSRERTPRRSVRRSVRTSSAVLVAVTLVAGACAGAGDAPVDPAQSATESGAPSGAEGPRTVVIVLPPADRLADSERVRVRMLVDRALDEVILSGPRPTLLEPTTVDAVPGTVESAVRRADVVCVLGTHGRDALVAALILYPGRTGCVLPLAPGTDHPALAADVDLERVGRALGEAARSAAGEGTVVVLDGGDGMLDRRWGLGVLGAAPGPQHVVLSAEELLLLLAAQDEVVAQGLVPGSPEAVAGYRPDAPLDLPDGDDVPVAVRLPPVAVVVLDGSPSAAALVDEVLDRGLRVVAPRSLLLDRPDHPGVVLRWRVRWDQPLTVLLRRILVGDGNGGGEGDGTVGGEDDVLVLEPGPAAARG